MALLPQPRLSPLRAAARARWLEARQGELLSVPYFHVVFTVPEMLNVLALHAPRVFYDLLFRAAGGALVDLAQSRLDIQPGCLCVLHTWGQTLTLHPHIHCVVPGGGFSVHGRQRRSVAKSTFFLPVTVLSRRFRSLLIRSLRDAWREGTLKLLEHVLADAVALGLQLARAAATDWVVYCKPPFGGPQQVLAYLANYTHRIAISNSRIVSFDGERVGFRYRDYAHSNTQKLLTPRCRRVPAPLPAACAAPSTGSHPLLRLSRQPYPRSQHRTRPADDRRAFPSACPTTLDRRPPLPSLRHPAPCESSDSYRPRGRRRHARTRCDHRLFTADLPPTA
jgi:hypothetical protein